MTTVERVLLAGASGQTGQQVLRQLARTDIDVRALTRSAEKTDRLQRYGADDVAVGNLMISDDARTAVEGMDAVFTAVGSSPQKVLRGEEFVDGTGNINLVEAAVDAGVDTVVMVSSLGVGDDRNSWLARSFRLAIRPVVAAKTRAETVLRDADLQHTILRPGVLTPTWLSGSVQVADAGTGLWGTVARTDVARLMVAAPFTPPAANRTFELAANPLMRQQGLDIDWQQPATQ